VHRFVKLTDALMAATEVVHGLAVITQDSDLDKMAVAHPAMGVSRV